jgi:hypothetical protein
MHRVHYIQEQNVLFWQLDFQNKVIVVGASSGQHTLLGSVVWFTWASGNTHYWVLLLVCVGLGQHTLLGIVVGLCGSLGNTLCWV